MEEAERVEAAAEPRSSVEKVQAVLSGVDGREPETEEDAQLLSTFRMAGPIVARILPSDPEELDRMLLTLAQWGLGLRSDDAWRPATIAELFTGEPEFTDAINTPEGGNNAAHENPDAHEDQPPRGLSEGDRGGGDVGG